LGNPTCAGYGAHRRTAHHRCVRRSVGRGRHPIVWLALDYSGVPGPRYGPARCRVGPLCRNDLPRPSRKQRHGHPLHRPCPASARVQGGSIAGRRSRSRGVAAIRSASGSPPRTRRHRRISHRGRGGVRGPRCPSAGSTRRPGTLGTGRPRRSTSPVPSPFCRSGSSRARAAPEFVGGLDPADSLRPSGFVQPVT
jgi:hypothetical protein